MENNFCDILFSALEDKAVQKRGLLLKFLSFELTPTGNSTQLNSILFVNHITFDKEYMKCAHKRQKIETAIK